MVRIYCDICKKQMPEHISDWALAGKMNIGDLITDLRKVVQADGEPDDHGAMLMDICPKCKQKLNTLVKDFINKECAKK